MEKHLSVLVLWSLVNKKVNWIITAQNVLLRLFSFVWDVLSLTSDFIQKLLMVSWDLSSVVFVFQELIFREVSENCLDYDEKS